MDPTHSAERDRLSRKAWVQTFTGRKFTPLDPHPEDVDIVDIAHALAQKVRYTGHTRGLYSVGQHSLGVARLLPASFKLAGLLHDATEAYLPDVAAPIKGSVCVRLPGGICSFREAEDRLADVIFEGLGLSSIRSLIDSEEVKRADLIMLATEVRDLMGPAPDDWGLTQEPNPSTISIERPELIERGFLMMFEELRR